MTTNFKVMHIVPVDDESPHNEIPECWCDPSCEESGGSLIYTHNSADMREEFERATGDALPGKPWLCIRDDVPMELDPWSD